MIIHSICSKIYFITIFYLEIIITESVLYLDGEYTPILFSVHNAIEPEITWYINDQEIPFEYSDSLYIYENGIYQVDIYDQEQDCFGTDTMFIRDVSLSEEFVNSFNIYPNPAVNSIMIESSNNQYQISIYNIQGVLLKKKISSNFITNLDISDLSPSMYIIELLNEKDKKSQILIVH